MNNLRSNRWGNVRTLAYSSMAALITACGGGYGGGDSNPTPTPPAPAPGGNTNPSSAFSMTPLISDGSVSAQKTDANLKNPWGIVFAPGSPMWVANNGTQTATLYDGTGNPSALIVSLPAGMNGDADATGIVVNPTTDFAITNGTATAAARFIFDGEGGTIIGWAQSVDSTHGIIAYDDGAGGAVYKGLAVATANNATLLYATDFKNGKVDVFDKTFQKITVPGGFTDPTLPANYAPFGIQAVTIGGTVQLVVTYAQKLAGSDDNANGAGLGLVNTFDTQGTLLKHLVATGAQLNAPWGVAIAPANFGNLSNALLIGNFGDGVINGFDASTGAFIDSIKNSAGTPIANPGLWGMAFGNDARNQPGSTLFFAAGIANEVDGLYGRIDLGATAPDTVAPTVSVTAPAAAATVSGSVQVTADAADDKGVSKVEFFAGATSIGVSTTAPYAVTWNTTGTADGSVNLTARATDTGGNLITSATVAVTVNNAAAPPPPPPTVTLTQLQSTIFTPRCASCHTGGGAGLPSSMDLTTTAASFAALVNVTSLERTDLKRVLPNDSANSYIIHKLEGNDIVGDRMPRFGPFLDQATIDTVKTWINAGAQNN
jgi:uncharacterized protein (TIGR03118 family)